MIWATILPARGKPGLYSFCTLVTRGPDVIAGSIGKAQEQDEAEESFRIHVASHVFPETA